MALTSSHIAVLCGGPSAEADVSRLSGAAVAAALSEAGVAAQLVDLTGASLAELDDLDCDLVFNALHGAFGEDGQLQRLLDERSLPYTGSRPGACELSFDKHRAKEAFRKYNVPTPAGVIVGLESNAKEELNAASIHGAVVAKPLCGGSSQGVTLVYDRADLSAAISTARAYEDDVLVEEMIIGRELTVGILDGKALPIIELQTERAFYNYEAKYEDEQTTYLCPASLPEAIAEAVTEAALKANEAMGAEQLARVDLLLDATGKPWVLELNVIPGFTSHSLLPKAAAVAGIPFPDLCVRLLELAEERAASIA